MFPGEGDQSVDLRFADRHALRLTGDSGISRSGIDLRRLRRTGQGIDNGVLAAARSDDKEIELFHGLLFLYGCFIFSSVYAGERGEFAASAKPQIHNSIFNIQKFAGLAWSYIPTRGAACGARASSGTNCGPPPAEAAARCGFCKVANSKLKIKRGLRTRLGIYSVSGHSLRRAHTTARSCGPPPPPGCGPLIANAINPTLQPARSRADGPARADLRDASCSPPPRGSCGLPVLTDRFCRQVYAPQPEAAARRSLRDRIRIGLRTFLSPALPAF